jgi:hypothetical protein
MLSGAFCRRRISALSRERFPANAFPGAVAITRAAIGAAFRQRRLATHHRQRKNKRRSHAPPIFRNRTATCGGEQARRGTGSISLWAYSSARVLQAGGWPRI